MCREREETGGGRIVTGGAGEKGPEFDDLGEDIRRRWRWIPSRASPLATACSAARIVLEIGRFLEKNQGIMDKRKSDSTKRCIEQEWARRPLFVRSIIGFGS